MWLLIETLELNNFKKMIKKSQDAPSGEKTLSVGNQLIYGRLQPIRNKIFVILIKINRLGCLDDAKDIFFLQNVHAINTERFYFL